MVLLISGGLLVLGLLAIVAMIWVIRSTPTEDRPARGLASAPPRVEVAPALESEEREALPAGENHAGPALALLNPELHALATQLRTLHQQSTELEQRLDILIQVVERIERSLPAQTEAGTSAGAGPQEQRAGQS
ncbi:hypothetical protein [Thermogemmatispora sp.]|uniref:hypothetical protein n=1 Tax=Thermogemmatispora sp. TaxID=1968838 RepID=UPI0035E3F9A0